MAKRKKTAAVRVKKARRKRKNPNKGSIFERSICATLSEWWSNGERDDVFWRSSTSGGRATRRSKRGKTTYGHYGDVAATHPSGRKLLEMFTIELKCGYPRVTIADLLDRVSSRDGQQQFEKWLEQVVTDWERAGSEYWLLIVQRKKRDAVVFYPGMLDLKLSQLQKCKLKISLIANVRWANNSCPRMVVNGIPLESFLRVVSKRDVVQLLSDLRDPSYHRRKTQRDKKRRIAETRKRRD